MRQALKSILEAAITLTGAPRVFRHARRTDTLVLAYHGVVPDGAVTGGDCSLHLTRARFAEQLDVLVRTHEVVPLADIHAANRSGRPRAVITFDDAYQGALAAGVPELVKRGLPATIFVAPAFVGGRDFWWDVLAGPHGLGEATRAHALHALAGRDESVRQWAARQGLSLRNPPAYQRCASEEELGSAASKPGITLGSHSWAHVNLARLTEAEIEDELTRSMDWLRERYSNVVPWLAYPYGLSSPSAERVLARLGFSGALRVEGGYRRSARPPGPYAVPRLNVPAGVSLRGFTLRVSGILEA